MEQSKGNIHDDLKSGKLHNLYLLFGQENFLVRHYSKAIEKAIPGAQKDSYDASTPAHEIIMAAETLPFFMGESEKRVIYVNDSKLFTSGRKADSEAMAAFLPNIPPDTILVFVEADVDRRSKLYKTAVKHGRAVDCEPPSPPMLTKWIIRSGKENGKTISPATASHLVRTTGTDMNVIHNEIKKLAALAGSENEITTKHIAIISATTLESRIFELTKAVGAGNTPQALKMYRNMLALKESPIMILTMIIRQYRNILLAKCAHEKGLQRHQIAAKLNLRDFIITEALEQSRRFTKEKLLATLNKALKTDTQIKTGLIAPEIGVELLIIQG
ncbi:MAG: DNA polymerase III subunit delta [Defluviitaleaceae bacterium]|nr:DNA polymerase III subunit delta [Defluviitaleaceae bacterium]